MIETIDTDVAVIAAGPAGLAAAIAAAQSGLSVTVFEKTAITGGTANRGMGPLGIESRHTRARLLEPTKDQAFKAFMDYTHWRVDAKLVRALVARGRICRTRYLLQRSLLHLAFSKTRGAPPWARRCCYDDENSN